MISMLKKYIFLPITMLFISVYILGISLWLNRSYEIHAPHGLPEDMQESNMITVENNAKLNINTASKEDLMKLDGIGEKTAESIIEKRTVLGTFSSVDQLIEVKGIGEKTLESLKQVITAE